MMQLLSVLFGLTLGTSSPALSVDVVPATAQQVTMASWKAQKNDRFVVDSKNNMGYLVHEDGTYAAFVVATGRNEEVYYLGMKYVATTPTGKYVVKSRNTSPDRITFGPEGRFLRLFKDGKEYTRYGIHDYAYLDEILKKDTQGRFFSMGCVLVAKPILNIMEETYELNDGELEVAIVYGLDAASIAQL